jgi:hypothetical protein
MAWILATNPDTDIRRPAEAVRLAQHACELTRRKVPEVLDTMAAAYAASGQYRKAVETAQAAMDLARAKEAGELAAEIGRHLDLYQQSKPYLEP